MKFSKEGIETYSDLKEEIGYRNNGRKPGITYQQNLDNMIDHCLNAAQYNLGCIVFLLKDQLSRRTYDIDSFPGFMEELEMFLDYVKKGFFINLKEEKDLI